MWFALRILTLIAVYVYKLCWRRQAVDTLEDFRGIPSLRKVHTHKGRFQRAYLGLAYEGPLRFQLTTEGGWDSFFKGIGLAAEQQAGDPRFDGEVYITCDQVALGETLRAHPAARDAVLRLLHHGVDRIFSDGAAVWAETKEENHHVPGILENLQSLRAALLQVDANSLHSRLDAFFWKAVAIESLVWSIAAYGIPGFIELTWNRDTVYLAAWPVFRTGFLWSLAVLAGLLVLVIALLRGSSRGHRVIVESVAVLLIGVPFSTVQAVSDINIHLDDTPPTLVHSAVKAKNIEVNRERRRSSTHYYLDLVPTSPGGQALEGTIEVEPSLYHAVAEGKQVTARLRAGRLGFRWIESIEPGG